MTCLLLFAEFFKIGLFCIGGGLAALPFLFELAEKYAWFTAADLANMVAISESTPGPIACNMATYAGYATAGIPGAVCATTAVALPSLLLSLLICRLLNHGAVKGWLEKAGFGLRPAVAGLIAAISLNLIQLALFHANGLIPLQLPDIKALVCFALLLIAVFCWRRHTIVYILIGAALGLLLQL